jgi:hypothetical protein
MSGVEGTYATLWTKPHTGSFKNSYVAAPAGGPQRLAQYRLQPFLALAAEASIELLAAFAA